MLYLAMDYSSASAPGVFFVSDAEVFYLEGLVGSRVEAAAATLAVSAPAPAGGARRVERERPAARLAAAAPPRPVAVGPRAAIPGPPPPSGSEDH